MMKKTLLTGILLVSAAFLFGQSATTNNCIGAEPQCSDEGTSFDLSTGGGDFNDLPNGNNISNPSTNPGAAGNSGCLLSNELNPNWFLINIGEDGVLEFTVGSAGSTGLYDWAMWPYYENPDGTTACDDITNNILPPFACNWNGPSAGFTGMVEQGSLPAGADQANFEYALPVLAGEQYILCFSNYSSGTGTIDLTFGNDIPGNNNPNSAEVTCDAVASSQTVCLGEDANVTISMPPNVTNPSFEWLNTTGVSDPTSGTNVTVSVTETTDYSIAVFNNGIAYDTVDLTITVVEPPTPNAGLDEEMCIGVLALDGTQSDPNNTIEWTHDLSQVPTNPFISYNPDEFTEDPFISLTAEGTYQFILNETNDVCGTITDTVEVLVSETEHTTSFVSPTCSGATDGSITIDNPEGVDYSFDNGTTWGTSNTMGGLGVGTYTVYSRNQYGCEYYSDVTITEPDPIVLTAGNDTTICQNGTADLWATINASGINEEYIWSHASGTAANATISPTSNTTVQVYAQNATGCQSNTAEINITVRPVISATISGNDTICPGYPTNVTVSGISGGLPPYDISWSSGETGNGNAMTIEADPSVTTTYTVTITDVCETNSNVQSTEIVVAPVPVPQMSIVDPDLCEPAVFEIANQTDPALSAMVEWNISDGQLYENSDTIFTEEMYDGDYDVQLIVTSPNGCIDSITNADYLTVYDTPTANFFWSPNPVKMFNTKLYFSDMSHLAEHYSWTFEQGVPSYSSNDRPTVQFPDGVEGQYDVTMAVTSEFGCVDTITKRINVLPEVLVYAPNTFTPDGDEFNQTWKMYLEGVDIYSFNVVIFNRWGEVIWESNDASVGWDGTHNGKPVKQGTYVWKATAKDITTDNKFDWQGTINLLR